MDERESAVISLVAPVNSYWLAHLGLDRPLVRGPRPVPSAVSPRPQKLKPILNISRFQYPIFLSYVTPFSEGKRSRMVIPLG